MVPTYWLYHSPTSICRQAFGYDINDRGVGFVGSSRLTMYVYTLSSWRETLPYLKCHFVPTRIVPSSRRLNCALSSSFSSGILPTRFTLFTPCFQRGMEHTYVCTLWRGEVRRFHQQEVIPLSSYVGIYVVCRVQAEKTSLENSIPLCSYALGKMSLSRWLYSQRLMMMGWASSIQCVDDDSMMLGMRQLRARLQTERSSPDFLSLEWRPKRDVAERFPSLCGFLIKKNICLA